MKRRILWIITLFFMLQSVQALFISDAEWGYSLDLPEGFVMTDGNGKDRYQFKNTIAPVEFVIALYPKTAHVSAKAAAGIVLSQLGGKGDIIQTNWRRNQCAIAHYAAKIGNTDYSGWIVALELKNDKGFAVFTAFAHTDNALKYENFIVSCLDSIGIDDESWLETGPMTAFAFQNEGSSTKKTVINGKTVNLTLDTIDAEANQFIVDREFGILTLYDKSDLWQDAWKRYYRLIYRDAYTRLAPAAAAIKKILPTTNDFEAANLLLHWTQKFDYARDFQGSDFTALPALLSGSGGDCDSRALLLAVLLRHMGYRTVLFISPDYSHSVAGIDIIGQGARISVDGIPYLVAETTAKINLGLIAQNFADPEKWIAVTFYEINKL